MMNNSNTSSHSAAPAAADQQNIPSPATSSSSGQRPRQFQFRKGPGAPLPKPEGESSDFKSRVLRHWNDWVADYDRRNEAALKRLSEEHASIWRETPRVPLVLQPLSPFEQRLFSSGHLQSHVSMRDGSSGTAGPSSGTGSTNNTNNNAAGTNNQQQQPGQRPPYQKKKFSKEPQSAGWREEHEKKESDGEDILWATEESGVGMFDAQGNFKFITESVLQDQSGVKSQIDKSVLFGSRHVAAAISVPPALAEPIPEPQVLAESNEWFYKDPKGNVQGPFQSTQMLEWYNRRYFPDNLPLKRASDALFEPLSIWKLRCEGRSPFEIVKPPQALAAPGFSPPIVSTPESIRFGSLSSVDDPIVNVPIRKSPIVSPSSVIPTTSAPAPQPAAAAAKIPEPQAPKESEVDKQARFLESLMLKSKGSKSSLTSTGPTEPVSLQAIMAEQAEQVDTKYSAPVPSPAVIPAPSSKPVITASAPSVNTAQPAVAWKTVSSTPTASLVDIKRQQETESAKVKQQQQQQANISSGPKSFADLLAASSSPSAVVEPKKNAISPIAKPPASSAVPVSGNPATTQQPIGPRPAVAKTASSDPLKDWMSSKLTAVEAVDVAFLYALLSECHSAEEAAILLRDNLFTIADDSVDLKAFSREYLKRRYGKQIPAYVFEIVNPRTLDDRDLRPEAEFSTVSRKKK